MGLIAVPVPPAAPETHANLSCVSDHLSTETTKTEFRDAGELRAEFDSINNNIETKALGVITSIEEMLPFLRSMQALLSQRGTERLRGDAALPTWTEYCESLRQKLHLSFRTIQRRLAVGSSGQGDGGGSRSAPKTRRLFTTCAGLGDSAGYRGMLTDLLDQIERMGDKVPQALRNTVADYRKTLNAETLTAPPKIVPRPRATVAPKSLIEKSIARDVSKAVKNHTGTLIKT